MAKIYYNAATNMELLAINGGAPVRGKDKPYPAYNSIGEEEKNAAIRVLDSGVLSKFLGEWSQDFYGGTEVQQFEAEWAKKFGVTHAIAMNSATSGLIAALGAIGIEPGDEVIVPPYSMCISATAPLFYGAIPVFADIESEHFCLDPKSVEAAITPRTKAILVVDIFGAPHDADAIMAIARKHGLKVIEDAAQAPGALYKGRKTGTLSHIGVYSLNYHKHIHTGEGTVVVTEDDVLFERLQLIRNHAEAVVKDKGVNNLSNMVGYNFRMTELEASIGREQLRKLDMLISERQKNCAYIAEHCQDMLGFRPALIREGCTSVFYQHPFLYSENIIGVPRNTFIAAIQAELPETEMRRGEGPLISGGYAEPLYLLPLFQQQIAFGSKGYPFRSPFYHGEVHYQKGLCPVAERLHNSEYVSHEMMRPGMQKSDLDEVIEAFHKVYAHRTEIKK
ncbi:MAG: DegT/DnrJ/EryC1/StrS family aminotransferase [Candidatus Paceibacterota bacterium]|jgi:dTDP-4-amino-4,6-dideoxygalactose transaminase